MIEDLKIWFLLKMRIIESAIAAMRAMVGRQHQDASREDNEQRAKEMREAADQLAADAEELRADLKKGLREDRHPPPQQNPDE
jgi:hypothetical protein